MGSTDSESALRRFPFTYDGAMREVYVTPEPRDHAVVVIHELPGLSPTTLDLAEYLADDFEVYLPLMFGSVGQRAWLGGAVPGGIQTLCVRAEFLAMQSKRSSPVAEWLRALCRHIVAERGGSPVGVVGMCLTGALVFSMAWDPSVGAAVAAQPALPLVGGRTELTVSDEDLDATRQCLAGGTRMLSLRFANDKMSPHERIDALAAKWGNLVQGAPRADKAPQPPPLTTVTYPRTKIWGRQHATLTAQADATRDPTYERSRNRVRNFLLDALA